MSERGHTFWSSPTIYQDAATVAETKALIRKAREVWVRVRGGGALHFPKRAVLDSLRFKLAHELLPSRLYIIDVGGNPGSVYLGDAA